ncbi:hypothetical protein GCM10009676_19450 [Prauserella halophila]|uniref:DUF4185 domain-containing protein n=1 Tax=Prauserella halophila TaxID=185641 RepID=A0ABN1W5H7_9PSEU|nr:DUF4185 domain-containing protein [Prauserella halophila]MCP2235854.1 protein of unknown function (DUF4185) [Prauserella halophila]
MDVRPVETERIAKVTGADSANRTDERFAFAATDLGILWDAGGDRVFALFGDTFGDGWGGHGAGPASADWRSNVLAWSSARELSGGLPWDGVVARPGGGAAQVIPSGRREVTVVPNGAITVDGVHYAHYMSVREWGKPGHWRTNHAGVAVSYDDGSTWRRPRSARWPNRHGRSRFQLGAFARDGEYVLLFGTTNGRYGVPYLARVRPSDLLRVRAYEYWDGSGWRGDEDATAPLFDGPAGEMSVGHHRGCGRWLLLHLDEPRRGIVIRTAPTPTGPWTGGDVVVSGDEHPAIYGGFLHPWSLDGTLDDAPGPSGGFDVYYLVSQWGPYNVFLTRTRFEIR